MPTGGPTRSAVAERGFLQRALGGPPASGRDPGLDSLAEAVDWGRVLETAPPGVRPYLAHCLDGRLSAASVPPPIREELARVRRSAVGQYLARYAELRSVLGAMDRARVPVLVLKGMALAHTVYPDPALRLMVDIDLLVAEPGWDAARDVLTSAGLGVPERWQVRPRSGANARPERERPFQRPGGRVLVELHARLESWEPPFAFPAQRAWERAVPVSLRGLEVLTLHPEDELVHVILHLGSAHRFQHGLRGLLDLHLHLERHARDWSWPQLARELRTGGAGCWAYLALRLARDLLGSPVPDSLFAELPAPAALEELLPLALDQLWHAESVRVPPGLAALGAAPPSEHLRWVLGRLNPWRREDGGRVASRRALVDLRTRVPLYLAAWKRGDLSRSRRERAAELLRGRDRIGELMDRG